MATSMVSDFLYTLVFQLAGKPKILSFIMFYSIYFPINRIKKIVILYEVTKSML